MCIRILIQKRQDGTQKGKNEELNVLMSSLEGWMLFLELLCTLWRLYETKDLVLFCYL
jgi:hypothetical protein